MSDRPLFSSAAIVLANVGRALALATLSTSAACSLMAASNAGAKCSGPILSNGGISNGPRHAASNGFCPLLLAATFLVEAFFVTFLFGALPMDVPFLDDDDDQCWRPRMTKRLSRSANFAGLAGSSPSSTRAWSRRRCPRLVRILGASGRDLGGEALDQRDVTD